MRLSQVQSSCSQGLRCTCAGKPCWSRHRREVKTAEVLALGDRKLGPVLRDRVICLNRLLKSFRSDWVPCQQSVPGGCAWVAQTYLRLRPRRHPGGLKAFGRATQQGTPGAARSPAPTPAQPPAAMGCVESPVLLLVLFVTHCKKL